MGYQQGFHELEMPGVPLASVLRMEELSQRLMHRLVLPFHPPNYELAIYRSKTGGVVTIMARCNFELHQCDQYFCHQNADIDSHTPLISLHWPFHPWSNVKALENVRMNTHRVSYLPSLEDSHLSDTASMADNSHFVALPQPHSFKSVPLGGSGAPGPLGLHNHIGISHLCQSNEIKLISVEDSWGFGLLVFYEVGRDIFCNLVLHFICFLLPPILYCSPPPVGIGFSQDQVTWSQWNGISFSIIVPLLSFSPWCGLCMNLFKGSLQLFT